MSINTSQRFIWIVPCSIIIFLSLYKLYCIIQLAETSTEHNPHIPLISDWPAKAPVYKQCHELGIPDSYWSVRSEPFVDIPVFNKAIQPGESICIRVVVPGQPCTDESFAPFPNSPWDSILLDLVGTNTGINIPVDLQMVKNANNYACNSTHIYEADVILKDIDVFVPQGYMEYRQAQWNGEDHTNTQPLVPEPLQISSELQVHVASNDISKFALDNYLNLPLCTEPDSEGRWIPIDAIPFDKSHLPKQDNFERVWLPYNCRLYPYSYEEFAECTSKKHNLIHWFGDSNTRRALKKISSMGSWCSKPDEVNTQLCKCNDNVESLGQQDPRLPMIPINIGPHSKIMHFRWGGLTQINNPPWLNTFSSDFANITDTPSLAIFALVNWDVAFSTRSFFIQQVEILLDKITEYYPSASTEIIVRTGQYYCCAYDQDIFWKRKFSRLRTLYFNQYITQAFQKRFGNEQRVSIWDVSQLSERRPYKAREEAAQTCAPNHARAELVDIENQLLFNRLCN